MNGALPRSDGAEESSWPNGACGPALKAAPPLRNGAIPGCCALGPRLGS